MVDAINIADNSKSGVVNNAKPAFNNVVQRPALTTPKDEVVLSNNSVSKPVHKKTPMNKAQVVGLAVAALGAAGSIVIAGIFVKTSGVFGANKLLKEIKKADLPAEIKTKLLEEYAKLKNSFGDSTGSKNYIREVLKMSKCFKKPEPKIVDIARAKEILDKKIVGLDEVKAQVIDYLKIRNYHIKNGTNQANKLVLCLDGPPGVGKTTIAEAIAEAMEAPFERIGLSGIDKATQIVGGERIWQGAAPGKVIKAVQNSQSSSPVILLDEMDKLGHNAMHGDPGEALLDVLEPKQCKHFTDNYLEFPFDLSSVNFIITSNDLNKISKTLKDRIHLIKIPPYTEALKTNICHLELGNKMKASKIDPAKVKFDNSAITQIVRRGLDDDGRISSGARKALDNLSQVFDQVLIALDENPDKAISVNAKFVDRVLDKYKA